MLEQIIDKNLSASKKSFCFLFIKWITDVYNVSNWFPELHNFNKATKKLDNLHYK
jgi:hypothetical protein